MLVKCRARTVKSKACTMSKETKVQSTMMKRKARGVEGGRGHSRHLKRGHLDSEHAPDSSRCFPFKILRIFAPAASKSGKKVCFVKDRTAQQWHWRGRLRRHRDWISKILQQLVRHCNWDQISTASWKMALSSVVVGTKDLEERWEVQGGPHLEAISTRIRFLGMAARA